MWVSLDLSKSLRWDKESQAQEANMQCSWLTMPHHRYLLVADQGKLVFVGSPDANLQEARQYVNGPFEFNDEAIKPFQAALTAYLTGKTRTVTVPVTFHGTILQEAVWQCLLTIPYGETRTYAQVAAAVGHDRAFQAVGHAVGQNPLMMVIPCHRILRKNGGLGGFRGGLALKCKLLALEQGA